MTTLAKSHLRDNSANELLLTAAAETQMRMLSRRADNLLQEIDDVDPITAKSLRDQAAELFSTCHRIVRLLNIGDLEGAASVGDTDQSGGVVGAVA